MIVTTDKAEPQKVEYAYHELKPNVIYENVFRNGKYFYVKIKDGTGNDRIISIDTVGVIRLFDESNLSARAKFGPPTERVLTLKND